MPTASTPYQTEPETCDLLPQEYAALLAGAVVAPAEMKAAVTDVLNGSQPLSNADLRTMIAAAAEACGASIGNFLSGRATRGHRPPRVSRRSLEAGAGLAERVKAVFRVEEVAERLTDLRPASRGALMGLCPFHAERSASFYVWPETQTWKCFGCNRGGDVITLRQEAMTAGLAE